MIYRITGFGDTSYYKDLGAAQRDVRACSAGFGRTVLSIRGRRVIDEVGHTVGDVIAEADVPARDRWQLRGQR